MNPGVLTRADPVPDINRAIAQRFDTVAAILEGQHANPYRVDAYRAAAATLRRLGVPVSDLLERDGVAGLERLPTIGSALARGIRDVVLTGRLPVLDRLTGEGNAVAVLASIPGIGVKTAERLHAQLGLETLEELEVAAHDGRLARVPGMGPKRIAGIRDCLAARLGRLRAPFTRERQDDPSVRELLDVDRAYLEAVARDALPRIAPRRFNPEREAWLPVLHTVRGDHHYTAMFSNTAHAHRRGRTRDWVVIYFDGTGRDRQATVVTERVGPLAGRRVVRGREEECEQFYAAALVSAAHGQPGPATPPIPAR